MKVMITEEKKEKLSGYTEKILHYAGRLMSCVEHLEDESYDDDESMGERYGRMGMRNDMDDDDYGMRYQAYGDRRSRGRYARYR